METIHLHNKKFNIQFQICLPEGMVSRLESRQEWPFRKRKNKKSEPASYLLGFWLEQNQRHFQLWQDQNGIPCSQGPCPKSSESVSTLYSHP